MGSWTVQRILGRDEPELELIVLISLSEVPGAGILTETQMGSYGYSNPFRGSSHILLALPHRYEYDGLISCGT